MIESELTAVYEEIMWLAKRPNVTPSSARAWYTHIVSTRLRKSVRRFTGNVSENALIKGAELRLAEISKLFPHAIFRIVEPANICGNVSCDESVMFAGEVVATVGGR